jgi:hypothetical protein
MRSTAAAIAASSAEADGMDTWVGNHARVSDTTSALVAGVKTRQHL